MTPPDLTPLITAETAQMVLSSPAGVIISLGVAIGLGVGLALRLRGKVD